MKQNQKILHPPDPEFHLIGIASHENDYRLAWAINSVLKISLAKSEDAVVFHDKYKHDISLSLFTQNFAEQGYSLKLFANKGDNFFLLEEYKNIDFFMKIEGEISEMKLLYIKN
ncbi:MAG: IPExxxVDY family protein [Bacteroidetes bacterium]|nr:IPExxxVDY family protein [Bacteroidota bacterium]